MTFSDYWQAREGRRLVAEALAVLTPDDPRARQRFLAALRQAVLLLPVAELPPGYDVGDAIVGQKVPLRVTLVHGADKQPYLDLFTSESQLREHHPSDLPYVLVPFPVLAELALSAKMGGMIIDRNRNASAVLTPPTLRTLLSQDQATPSLPAAPQPATPRPPTPPTQPPFRVGPPPRVVTQYEIHALDQLLRRQPGLSHAYLFGLVRGNAINQATMALALGYARVPDQATLQALAAEITKRVGTAGVMLMDERLAALLARQPGAIRFEFMASVRGDSGGGTPPSDLPPAPASPDTPA